MPLIRPLNRRPQSLVTALVALSVTTVMIQPATCQEATTDLPVQETIDQQSSIDSATTKPGTVETAGETNELEEAEKIKIDLLIAELGADRFADREKAAFKLIQLGEPALARLQYAATESADLEVRSRARSICKRINRSDIDIRIDDFLRGRDVPLDGWQIMRQYLGDTDSSRKLFVEILRAYPDEVALIGGTSRDKGIALANVNRNVQIRRLEQLKAPEPCDVVLMVLLAVDPAVPLNDTIEREILSALRMSPSNKIFRDATIGEPFAWLVSGWGYRVSLANRTDFLEFAMQTGLTNSLSTSIKTLAEATDGEQVVAALQTIARFGNQGHLTVVTPWLGSTTKLPPGRFDPPNNVDRTVGDAAMAAAAKLCGLPMKELGFPKQAESPIYGFDPQHIGYSGDVENRRSEARIRIDEAIEAAFPKRIPRPLPQPNPNP